MAGLREYKCPACGGALEFNSGIQKMKCPYCDTEFEMEAIEAYEEELNGEQEDDMVWEAQAGSEWQDGETDGIRLYVCESCGGEIAADENTGASSCPFCGNPIVMTEQFQGELRPDYVIPFKLDKKAAKNAYLKHIQRKPLLPRVFKEQNHIDEIKGIYVPFWLFDADAHANIRYRATRVRMWSDKDYNYTRTSFYAVKREGDIGFERVPVDGSSRMADDLMESIEPFDFGDAVDFQTAYLAGYLADKYDVNAEDSAERANERIRRSTETAFRETVRGYQSVITENCKISLSGGTAKYALYPVWLLNTTWKGKKFTFAMNGQTGKFIGDLPVDNGAFLKWFCGLTAAFSAAAYLIAGAVTVFGAGTIPDERQLPRLVDYADLLSSEQENTLAKELDQISEKYECDVAIVTTNDTDGISAREYADDFYDYNGYGMGEGDDGILLLLDMGEHNWAISTYGYGIQVFTDDKMEYMAEKYLPYLKDGDYMEAFTVFADLCGDLLGEARTGETDVKEKEQKQSMSLLWIPGSIIIGMFFSLIVTGIMRYQMKSVRKQVAASGYMKPGSLRITGSRELFLYSKVDRIPRPKPQNSGGGSSLHTSSSGRSHGGSGGSF